MHSGPCFTVVPKGFVSPSHWLPITHTVYLKGEARKDTAGYQTIRVGLNNKAELFLVPINALQGTHLLEDMSACCLFKMIAAETSKQLFTQETHRHIRWHSCRSSRTPAYGEHVSMPSSH